MPATAPHERQGAGFESGLNIRRAPADDAWRLRLYVAGQTVRSLRAVANIHKLCAERLDSRYQLEVIDLYQQPQLARDAQIIAVPALVKPASSSPYMVVGDMADADQVVAVLELKQKGD